MLNNGKAYNQHGEELFSVEGTYKKETIEKDLSKPHDYYVDPLEDNWDYMLCGSECAVNCKRKLVKPGRCETVSILEDSCQSFKKIKKCKK